MNNLIVDQYINGFPEEKQQILIKVKQTISELILFAELRFSWKMLTFWYKENIIHFAAMKNYIGIYPRNISSFPFKDKLFRYKTSKENISYPYDNTDYELVKTIVRCRFKFIRIMEEK